MVKYEPLRYPKTNDVALGTIAMIADWTDKMLNNFVKDIIYCGNCGERIVFLHK